MTDDLIIESGLRLTILNGENYTDQDKKLMMGKNHKKYKEAYRKVLVLPFHKQHLVFVRSYNKTILESDLK